MMRRTAPTFKMPSARSSLQTGPHCIRAASTSGTLQPVTRKRSESSSAMPRRSASLTPDRNSSGSRRVNLPARMCAAIEAQAAAGSVSTRSNLVRCGNDAAQSMISRVCAALHVLPQPPPSCMRFTFLNRARASPHHRLTRVSYRWLINKLSYSIGSVPFLTRCSGSTCKTSTNASASRKALDTSPKRKRHVKS